MSLRMHDSLDAFLARSPTASRVFENLGIDYCCGGSRTLEEACRSSGQDPVRVIGLLDDLARESRDAGPAAARDAAELAAHIEATHHAALRVELPALEALAERVARVHGDSDPRLLEVRDVFLAFSEELALHMVKEEKVLFPAIKGLQKEGSLGGFHCGSLADPIDVMQAEHAEAAEALERLRGLTGDYSPPEWACNTYRALLDRLKALDLDLRDHVRKEEVLLFPRALELERGIRR